MSKIAASILVVSLYLSATSALKAEEVLVTQYKNDPTGAPFAVAIEKGFFKKEGIDISVAAWEKRDYWIKADKFRMEWMWTGQVADKMKVAIFTNDWGTIAMLMPQIAQKFGKIMVSDNHRLGKPWVGAYQQLTGQH